MRRLCSLCCKRPAKAKSKAGGRVRQMKGHDLCRQCFRSLRDRNRPYAKTLIGGA